jgi:hypothetical protein
MNIAIVTNMNGIGLQRDYELLNEFLTKRGHNVFGVQFDQPDVNLGFLADLTIFLEVIPTNFLGLGKVNWAILNAEWCKPDVLRAGQRMDRVFAKTFEGQRKMRDHFEKVFYCGFLTRDQGIEGMEKKLEFLHVGGNSSVRGTQAVFDAWKWKKNGARIEARLNIVSSLPIEIDTTDKRIYWWKHIDEAGLKHLQNSCAFHIYPSGTEGFGHAIHESLSTGAVLLTTDGPPMNEIHAGVKMKATVVGRQCLADLYEVSAIDIYEAAQDSLVKWRDGVISQMVDLARNEFLKDNEEFETLFGAHLADLENPEAKPVAVRSRSLNRTVAFIGNFKATESTENMIRIALEEGLNHDVETLQENEVNYPALKSAAKHAKMLLWVRTPNWLKIPDPHMNDLLAQLRADKIPTVSIHLDKFFGIPEREALVGNIPFWKTEHVFTADGSPAAAGFFRARGVNHHWMKPAVSEIYCHPGRPWDMYRCDVGFVGAKDYHAEYPFRRAVRRPLPSHHGSAWPRAERFLRKLQRRGGRLHFRWCATVLERSCAGDGWASRISGAPEGRGPRYSALGIRAAES